MATKQSKDEPKELTTAEAQPQDTASEIEACSPHVYKAIANVIKAMSAEGIAKDRSNQQQGYKFRGIDDVYNALSSKLAENGLVMLPRILSRDVQERQTIAGKSLFYVTVEAEFDMVAALDGSSHTIRTYGEAMDSADKATNKAMSAAFKYAAIMSFCIPTEGDNDADATHHELTTTRLPDAPPPPATPRPGPKPVPAPAPRAAAPAAAADDGFKSKAGDVRPITVGQQKRLFAIAKATGVPSDSIKAMLVLSGIESTADITRENYDTFIEWIQSGGKLPESDVNADLSEDADAPF